MIVRLRSGTDVLIRPIRPDDKTLIASGLARVSGESAYRRFLGPKQKLTAEELRYLTEVDFRDHVALVAVVPDRPDTMAGVARWVRTAEDPRLAEFAFLVSDELQGHGLGSALADRLVDAARALGVERLVATMLPHNVAAHRLVDRMSARTDTSVEGGMHEVRGDLAA